MMVSARVVKTQSNPFLPSPSGRGTEGEGASSDASLTPSPLPSSPPLLPGGEGGEPSALRATSFTLGLNVLPSAGSSYGNAKRTPILLPIQLACMVFTRSGQPGSLSRSASNSSAYFVI